MVDKVELIGMEFFGYHGCMKEERAIGQRFYVDVTMYLDLGPSGKSDDLKKTVNYADVFAEVRVIVEGEPFTLLEAVAERIAEGKIRRTIDLGCVTYRPAEASLSKQDASSGTKSRIFGVSCGIGFDAAVCEEVNGSGTKTLLNRLGHGKESYGAIALKNLMKGPFVSCRADMDDGAQTFFVQKMIFAAFMNLPYQGGGFLFAPDADPCDGKLGFVTAGNMSFPKKLASLAKVHSGKHYGIRGVEHCSAAKIRVRTAEPLFVHTDGEVITKADDITVECLPSRLQLLI